MAYQVLPPPSRGSVTPMVASPLRDPYHNQHQQQQYQQNYYQQPYHNMPPPYYYPPFYQQQQQQYQQAPMQRQSSNISQQQQQQSYYQVNNNNNDGINRQRSGSQDIRILLQSSPIKAYTFFDIIQKFVFEYEQKHTMTTEQQITKAGQSYSIYEDLKLLIEQNRPDQDRKSIKEISAEGIVNRSVDSIRTRYNHFLKNLQSVDLDQIYHYIKKFGMDGYLVFQKVNVLDEDGESQVSRKVFNTIQQQDPRMHNSNKQIQNEQQEQEEQQQQLKQKQTVSRIFGKQQNSAMKNLALKKRPLKIEQLDSGEEDDIEEIEKLRKKSCISEQQQQQEESSELKEGQQDFLKKAMPIINRKIYKKTPFKLGQEEKVNLKQQIVIHNKRKTVLESLNKTDKKDAEELDVVLTVIGSWMKIPKKNLVENLHQLSGDLNIFDKFLNSKLDHQMLWNEEEDEELRNAIDKYNIESQKIKEKLSNKKNYKNKKNNSSAEENIQEEEEQEKIQLEKQQQLKIPPEIKMFIKYKGEYSVKRRIEYLEIENENFLL